MSEQDQQVRVPDIGDFSDVDVIEVLVTAGDRVDAEQSLITLETDKAAMDVPAPRAGVVETVHVTAGDKVSEGDLILTFADNDTDKDTNTDTGTDADADTHVDAGADADAGAGAHASAPARQEVSGHGEASTRGETPAQDDGAVPAAEDASAPSGDRTGDVERTVDVRVPDIGDFEDVEIIEVLVQEGETVEQETPLITLESDKAAMDIPSPAAGRVVSLAVATGQRVSEGDVIARLATSDAGAAADDVGAPPPGGTAQTPGAAGRDAASAGRDGAGADDGGSGDDRGSGTSGRGDDRGRGDSGGSADDRGSGNGGAATRAGSLPPATLDEAGAAGGPVTVEGVEVRVPDIGDFEDVEIIEVLVSRGDQVEAEAPLITLESDKAAMDVPSPRSGRVSAVHVAVGDRVSRGDLIIHLDAEEHSPGDGESSAGADVREKAGATGTAPGPAAEEGAVVPAAASAPEGGPAAPSPPAAAADGLPAIDEAGFARAHAGPSVRRFARELGVDLTRVEGSGLKGRITAEDVKAWVKSLLSRQGGAAPAASASAALPAVPAVDFAKFGEVERQPLGRIQKISGPRLQAAWVNLPHVTQFDEADITDLEAARRRLKSVASERDVKLTPLAFLVAACARVLAEFPVFRSSLAPEGDALVMKHYTHIGFAADTPNGLVVPVIRNADQRDLFDLAAQLGELAALAREGRLKAAQMQGGVFTISSLGGIGGTAFTPIINAPEVAILGVSRAKTVPVWDGDAFVPRLMLPLSLSYDHRVIDGALAVRFTSRLAEVLTDVNALLPEELRS